MYTMCGFWIGGCDIVFVDSWADVLMMMAWLEPDMYIGVLVRNANHEPVIELTMEV